MYRGKSLATKWELWQEDTTPTTVYVIYTSTLELCLPLWPRCWELKGLVVLWDVWQLEQAYGLLQKIPKEPGDKLTMKSFLQESLRDLTRL